MKCHVTTRTFSHLSNEQLYKSLKLRCDVFVVEQACIYPDLDDKDCHQGTQHILISDTQNDHVFELLAYARCLAPNVSFIDSPSIGRVIVAPTYRSQGLARKIMLEAINCCRSHWPNQPITIGAQTYLQTFYEGLGFLSISEPYDEDGIMHIDMALPN